MNRKISLHVVLQAVIIGLLILSSTIYAIVDYTGLQQIVKVVRFGIVMMLFLVTLTYMGYYKKIIFNRPMIFFILLIFMTILVSLAQNSLTEIIPSALRYISYILIANAFYFICYRVDLVRLSRFFSRVSYLFLFIAIVFGYFEIVTGNVEFINGDFRVAGSFRKHQLAFALFLFVNLIIFIEFNIRTSKGRLRIFNFIIFLLSFYLFVRTGSRALLVIFFLVYFLMHVLMVKSFKSFLKILVIGMATFSLILGILLTTNISPRLKSMMTSQSGIYDPSTLTRLLIITNSLEGFKNENQLFGIGMGGFNEFYRNQTGIDSVAAHNNYLLFLIEGGIIGILLFLVYQIVAFFLLLKALRADSNMYTRSSLLLFLGIDIFSFLQNNYYFFSSEAIVWMIYGTTFYLIKYGQEESITVSSK